MYFPRFTLTRRTRWSPDSQPPRSVPHQLIAFLGNQNYFMLRCNTCNTSLGLLSVEILAGKLVTPVCSCVTPGPSPRCGLSCERSMIRAQSESGSQREGSTPVLGTRAVCDQGPFFEIDGKISLSCPGWIYLQSKICRTQTDLGSLINGLENDLILRSYLAFPWISRISFIVGLIEALRCADKDNYPGQPPGNNAVTRWCPLSYVSYIGHTGTYQLSKLVNLILFGNCSSDDWI